VIEIWAWVLVGVLALLAMLTVAAVRRAGQITRDERAVCARTRMAPGPCTCGEHVEPPPGEHWPDYITFPVNRAGRPIGDDNDDHP
jgi:hypothetical protein